MVLDKIKEKLKPSKSKKCENPLEEYFYNNNNKHVDKWTHLFEIYHKHFNRFRNKEITVVEFGVFKGGSLQMWKNYFGKKAKIIGVDIDPECEKLVEDQIEIYIGDQEDRNFLKNLMEKIGPIDIVIEDGGHRMKQQIHTFEEVWPCMKDEGVFLVEDVITSYWERYGGGYKRKDTFIEYSKNLIDSLNAGWSETDDLKINYYTETIKEISIYVSVIAFTKGQFKSVKPITSGEI